MLAGLAGPAGPVGLAELAEPVGLAGPAGPAKTRGYERFSFLIDGNKGGYERFWGRGGSRQRARVSKTAGRRITLKAFRETDRSYPTCFCHPFAANRS